MTKNLYIAIDTYDDKLSQIAIINNDNDVLLNQLIKSDALNDALKADEVKRSKINKLKLELKNTVNSAEIIDLEREIAELDSRNYLKKYHKMFGSSFSLFCFNDYENASLLSDLKPELISIIKGKNIVAYDSDLLLKNIGLDILRHTKSIKNAGKRWVITKGEWSEYWQVYSMRCNEIECVLSQINAKHDITPLAEKDKTLADAKGVLAIWTFLNKDHARRESRLHSDVTLHCADV